MAHLKILSMLTQTQTSTALLLNLCGNKWPCSSSNSKASSLPVWCRRLATGATGSSGRRMLRRLHSGRPKESTASSRLTGSTRELFRSFSTACGRTSTPPSPSRRPLKCSRSTLLPDRFLRRSSKATPSCRTTPSLSQCRRCSTCLKRRPSRKISIPCKSFMSPSECELPTSTTPQANSVSLLSCTTSSSKPPSPAWSKSSALSTRL